MDKKYESLSQEDLVSNPEIIKNVLIPNILMCGRPDESGYRSIMDNTVSDIRFGDDLTLRIMSISPQNTNIAIMDDRTAGAEKQFVNIRIDENNSVTIFGDHAEEVLSRMDKDFFDLEYQPVNADPALKLMGMKNFGSGPLLEKKVIRGIVSNPSQFKPILKATPEGRKLLKTPLGKYYQQLEWVDTVVEADFFNGYFSDSSSQFKKDRMEMGYNDTIGFAIGCVVRDIQVKKITTDQLVEFEDRDFMPASSMVDDNYPVSLRQLGYLLKKHSYQPITDFFSHYRDGETVDSYYQIKSLLEFACGQVDSEDLQTLFEIISKQANYINVESKTKKRLDLVTDSLRKTVMGFNITPQFLDVDKDKLARSLREGAQLDVYLPQFENGELNEQQKKYARKFIDSVLKMFFLNYKSVVTAYSLEKEARGNRVMGNVELANGLTLGYFFAPDKDLEKISISLAGQTIVFSLRGNESIVCEYHMSSLFEKREPTSILAQIPEIPYSFVNPNLEELMQTHSSLRQSTVLGLLFRNYIQSLR